MNNLSNERLANIANLKSPNGMIFPPSHAECAAIARELLAFREAADINPCIGYISKNAVMRMVEGKSRFCSLYPEPEREYKIAVYLDRPFTAPPLAALWEVSRMDEQQNTRCWSCRKMFTKESWRGTDGYCPHCDQPVDLEEDDDE